MQAYFLDSTVTITWRSIEEIRWSYHNCQPFGISWYSDFKSRSNDL